VHGLPDLIAPQDSFGPLGEVMNAGGNIANIAAPSDRLCGEAAGSLLILSSLTGGPALTPSPLRPLCATR